MENEKKSITFDSAILKQVVNFGALKYDPYQMRKLLRLSDEESEEFVKQFQNEESEIRKYYEQGLSIGEYNIDAGLAKKAEKGEVDASIELGRRQHDQKIDKLTKELFGI